MKDDKDGVDKGGDGNVIEFKPKAEDEVMAFACPSEGCGSMFWIIYTDYIACAWCGDEFGGEGDDEGGGD